MLQYCYNIEILNDKETIMILEDEYSQNRVALKKIKKESTICGIMCGLFMCLIVFELYYTIMISPIFLILMVIVAAVSITGFKGIVDTHSSASVSVYSNDIRLIDRSIDSTCNVRARSHYIRILHLQNDKEQRKISLA